MIKYKHINEKLSETLSDIFEKLGFDKSFSIINKSQRPDLCDFQCNGAFQLSGIHKSNPNEIAKKIASEINDVRLEKVDVTGGFINLSVSNAFIAEELNNLINLEELKLTNDPKKIIIDYGGPNIAKPLHVGHLRSAIIGESIKRLGRFIGHEIKGDVHLGDWGLQMGMVILGLTELKPELKDIENGIIPDDLSILNISIEDLNNIYPDISKRCKEDEILQQKAQKITSELQKKHKGYYKLWKYFTDISIESLKKDYKVLNIDFDLWLGESSVEDLIYPMLSKLEKDGIAYLSEGALVINVAKDNDKFEVKPFLVKSSAGSALYATTDLATIKQRIADYDPDEIIYVTDKRQELHFMQLFRAAEIAKISSSKVVLEHVGFGTMNGSDGKPFKTRSGGVMKLGDLIELVINKAKERIKAGNPEGEETVTIKDSDDIALRIGLASLKFADLINQPAKNYVFDPDRFCSFEGKTGAYVLYANTRIKSILRKTGIDKESFKIQLLPALSIEERNMMLDMLDFPAKVLNSFNSKQPNILADFLYTIASDFNNFYYNNHIMHEKDVKRKESWLGLSIMVSKTLEKGLYLLGIDSVDKM